MLASNPVDPWQAIKIQYHGPAGPSVPIRREDGRGLGGAVIALAGASLLTIGYVVGGFASAATPAVPSSGGAQPVDAGGGPAAKVGAFATPVPGEFRLGPGNAPAPGIVVPLAPLEPAAVPSVIPFDLGPDGH